MATCRFFSKTPEERSRISLQSARLVNEKGFIAGSLNIGLNGQYAVWVGTLIDINKPLVLVTEDGKEEEVTMPEINVALIGYAFMGRAHSNAYRQVSRFFSPRLTPRMKVLCGRTLKDVEKFDPGGVVSERDVMRIEN